MADWKSTFVAGREGLEMDKHFEQQCRQFQGFAAGVTTIVGEPGFRRQTAFHRVQQAVSLLRVFTPHASNIRDHSPIAIWGQAPKKQWECFESLDGVATGHQQRLTGFQTTNMTFDNQLIDQMLPVGLKQISEYLKQADETQYYEKRIDSPALFSRGVATADIADKLVYFTVSIETMLARSSTESIQQNLADRVAFLMEEAPDQRPGVMKTVKAGYAKQSAYVHHGKSPKVDDELAAFGSLVWQLFLKLSMNSRGFQTTDELFDWIETRKYS